MLRRWIFLAGGMLLLAALPLHAQDSLVGPFFGQGTSAYFSGQYVESHELLSLAIEGEPADPRAYYFRGLTYLKMGRPEEARLDFSKAAEIESADSHAFYDVSKALERVQGKDRVEIEKYRAKGRLAAHQRAKAVHRARYEAIRREEERVLRKNVDLKPEPLIQEQDGSQTGAPGKEAKEAGSDNPFEAGGKGESQKATEEEDNPFLAPSSPKAAAKATDETPSGSPFDEPEPEKAAEQPTEEAKTPEKEEPATSDKKDNPDDPFGDDETTDEAASAAKPATPVASVESPKANNADSSADEPADETFVPIPKPKALAKSDRAEAKPLNAKPPVLEPVSKTAGVSPVSKPNLGPGPLTAEPKALVHAPPKPAEPVPSTQVVEKSDAGDPFVQEPGPVPSSEVPPKRIAENDKTP